MAFSSTLHPISFAMADSDSTLKTLEVAVKQAPDVTRIYQIWLQYS